MSSNRITYRQCCFNIINIVDVSCVRVVLSLWVQSRDHDRQTATNLCNWHRNCKKLVNTWQFLIRFQRYLITELQKARKFQCLLLYLLILFFLIDWFSGPHCLILHTIEGTVKVTQLNSHSPIIVSQYGAINRHKMNEITKLRAICDFIKVKSSHIIECLV